MHSTFERLIEAYETGRISRRRLLLSLPALRMAPRAFAQATWRHALFGAVLGWLA